MRERKIDDVKLICRQFGGIAETCPRQDSLVTHKDCQRLSAPSDNKKIESKWLQKQIIGQQHIRPRGASSKPKVAQRTESATKSSTLVVKNQKQDQKVRQVT